MSIKVRDKDTGEWKKLLGIKSNPPTITSSKTGSVTKIFSDGIQIAEILDGSYPAIDAIPTAGSTNAVQSGGVKTYVDGKVADCATSAQVTQLSSKVGDLSDLETTDKSSIVNAINEARQSGGGGGGGASVAVVDNLNSDSATAALSAKQGKTINQSLQKTNTLTISREKTSSRLGYLVLDSSKTFAEQVASVADTIFEVQDAFDLSNATIQMGANSILKFNGGIISNGKIKGNNTKIISPSCRIFNGVTFEGTFTTEKWNACWFGAVADCNLEGSTISGTDNHLYIEAAFNAISNLGGNKTSDGYLSSFFGVYFPSGRYLVTDTVNLPTKASLCGDGVSTTIVSTINGVLFNIPRGSISYKDLYVSDISFHVPDHLKFQNSKAFMNEYGEGEGENRTYFARCKFVNCKFIYFAIPLDLRVSYYLRLDSCEFNSSLIRDCELLNSNDTSITNCMFTAKTQSEKLEAIRFTSGSLTGRDCTAGVNISGNDFTSGQTAITIDSHIHGMNISGNYFEPMYIVTRGGETLESHNRPVVNVINSKVIRDFVFVGNCAFETKSNWDSFASPAFRFFLSMNCSRLSNSNIDAAIAIPSSIKGSGNIGRLWFCNYTSLLSKVQSLHSYESVLLDSSKTSSEKDAAFQSLKECSESISTELNETNTEYESYGRNICAIYVDRKSGEAHSNSLMPMTPSGDSLHDLFVSFGAVYNSTGSDIEKTDWFGDSYTHKSGKWALNGIGDLTTEEIKLIYIASQGKVAGNMSNIGMGNFNLRTNMLPGYGKDDIFKKTFENSSFEMFYRSSKIVVGKVPMSYDTSQYENGYSFKPSDGKLPFYACIRLKKVIGVIDLTEQTTPITGYSFISYSCTALESCYMHNLKVNIKIVSPNFDKRSLLYLINNSAATSGITISLHADVYAKCVSGGNWYADISAALASKTLVALASI